jgi:hypothetical protein
VEDQAVLRSVAWGQCYDFMYIFCPKNLAKFWLLIMIKLIITLVFNQKGKNIFA